MEKEVVIENKVMQGCEFVQGGVEGHKLKSVILMCVYSGQKGPSTGLCAGFRFLELQLHSTNLETRGLCVHTGRMLKHSVSPLLNSE